MRVRHSTLALTLLLVALAAGGAACARFNRDWRAAKPATLPARGPAGHWSGIWRSDVNGHSGQLRAMLVPGGGAVWEARFRARFWGIFAYGYRVELTGRPLSDNAWTVEGAADLGSLAGGVFRCAGTVHNETWRATYESRLDRGTFELRRRTPGD